MKKGIANPKKVKNEYRDRLLRLYESRGIDTNNNCHWSTKFAEVLFNTKGRNRKPIISYSDYSEQKDIYGKKDITKKKAHDNIASSLRKHIDKEWGGTLSTEWIRRYCEFFGCSADYLLGYIKTPLHTTYDDIPLSFKAITALNWLQQQEEYDRACVQIFDSFGIDHTPHNLINLLNNIIASPYFPELLGGIEAYVIPQYDKPMFFLEAQESITGRADYHIPSNHNQIHKRPRYDDTGSMVKDDKGQPVYDNWLPLVKDENKPSDYRAIKIDDSFLKSVALNTIQKQLDDIKADYLNLPKYGGVDSTK